MRPEEWIDRATLERFAAEETDLHRIHSGAGVWVERYGADLLLCVRQDDEIGALREDCGAWARGNGFTIGRIFVKRLQVAPGEVRHELIAGNAEGAPVSVCSELGLRYQIDFAAGYSTGFFLDQRENRRFLRGVKPHALLNCFAYTCSFSVVAASVGATTTSVDVAKKALEWGRANFALNQLPTEAAKFWPDDVRDVLRRQLQRGSRFDAIVLDPPTFARNRDGKVFRVEDELPSLAEQAAQLLEPGGHLLLSTNCESLLESDLAAIAENAARKARRSGEPAAVAPMPDFPPGHGARTLWVKMI